MADVSGVVRLGENEKGEKVITIVTDEGDEVEYAVSRRAHVVVRDGQDVTAGDRLVGDEKSPLDPKKLLEIKGVRETQQYLVDEVQRVYRDQGVSIHDKHIEVIVRQMLRRVTCFGTGGQQVPPGREGRRPALRGRRTARSSRTASVRPKAGPSSWESRRRRSRPTRGSRRHRSITSLSEQVVANDRKIRNQYSLYCSHSY